MARSTDLLIVAVAAFAVGFSFRSFVAAPAAPGPRLEAHFSPRGGCTEAVVALVGRATHSVRVLTRGISLKPVVDALVAAAKRGVTVEVVLDRRAPAEHKAETDTLEAGGVSLWIDARHDVAHNEVVVTDAGTPDVAVETGSFGFTDAAERDNAENALTIRGARELAEQYEANFDRIRGQSTKTSR